MNWIPKTYVACEALLMSLPEAHRNAAREHAEELGRTTVDSYQTWLVRIVDGYEPIPSLTTTWAVRRHWLGMVWKCAKLREWDAAKLALRCTFAKTEHARSLYFSTKRIAALVGPDVLARVAAGA